MYDLLVWEKINFIWLCDMEEIKATNCIIKVHITSGNIKWHSFALRFRASNHKSTWQPLLPSAKGLSFTLCLLLYARVQVIFTFPFFILFFGKHFVLGWSWYIYISNWMYVSMNYYCWHHPKVNTFGGNIISPNLSLCLIKTS